MLLSAFSSNPAAFDTMQEASFPGSGSADTGDLGARCDWGAPLSPKHIHFPPDIASSVILSDFGRNYFTQKLLLFRRSFEQGTIPEGNRESVIFLAKAFKALLEPDVSFLAIGILGRSKFQMVPSGAIINFEEGATFIRVPVDKSLAPLPLAFSNTMQCFLIKPSHSQANPEPISALMQLGVVNPYK